MTDADERYLLYSDEGKDSDVAIRMLQDNGVAVRVEIAPPRDKNESVYPRLVTPLGSFIGLAHIRLFARERGGQTNRGNRNGDPG
jgi:hypothetical protein